MKKSILLTLVLMVILSVYGFVMTNLGHDHSDHSDSTALSESDGHDHSHDH